MRCNGDCIVNQNPQNCSFYEYQKDMDLSPEQRGNTIIKDDYKKSYYKQAKKDRTNTIIKE